MTANEQLIHNFYTCFQNKDIKGMQACYADHAIFSDAVFKNLNAAHVRAMWEMLITKGKDMRLEFNQVTANENSGSAHWDAYYTFSATGRKVVNKIDAYFEIEDGKIVKHIDDFNFYTWAKQALGVTGLLLGWTGFLKSKIQKTAKENLDKFMAK